MVWAPGSQENPDPGRLADADVSPSGRADYERRSWVSRSHVLVSVHDYEGYPVRGLDGNGTGVRYLIEGDTFVEGGEIREVCEALGELLLERRGSEGRVRRALRRVDGDFVIAAFHQETGRLTVATDFLGRLPLYVMHASGVSMVSRDVTTVLRYMDGASLDPRGVAEYLSFGFSLGRRTIYEGLERLPPATILRYSPERLVPREWKWGSLRFDRPKRGDRDLDENAEALAARFRDAARMRHGSKTVVSLSGGLDSRSVAAALRAEGESVTAATYLDPDGRAAGDAKIAKKIADCLDLAWRRFDLPEHTERHERDLCAVKAGLNPLSMTYILPYFEAILSAHGPGVTYLTGDGGDKVLPLLTAPRRLGNLDDLVDLIVEKQCVMPPDVAARLAGIGEQKILDTVRDRATSYPEGSWSDRYVHFLVAERAVKFNFEGEDRNRHFFWSSTPFYSGPVFEYAFRCPDSQKAYYRLYREFLRCLSPEVAKIERPAFGGAITDSRHTMLRRIQRFIGRFPAVESVVDDIRSGRSTGPGESRTAAVREWAARNPCDAEPPVDAGMLATIRDENLLGRRESMLLQTVLRGSAVAGGAGTDEEFVNQHYREAK